MFNVGDRVCYEKGPYLKYRGAHGTVFKIVNNSAYIKWDNEVPAPVCPFVWGLTKIVDDLDEPEDWS